VGLFIFSRKKMPDPPFLGKPPLFLIFLLRSSAFFSRARCRGFAKCLVLRLGLAKVWLRVFPTCPLHSPLLFGISFFSVGNSCFNFFFLVVLIVEGDFSPLLLIFSIESSIFGRLLPIEGLSSSSSFVARALLFLCCLSRW